VSGGDSRIALDPASGLNRYLCPPTPDAWLVCLGSCTASPISPEGFAASHRCFDDLISATGREAVDRHARWEAKIRAAMPQARRDAAFWRAVRWALGGVEQSQTERVTPPHPVNSEREGFRQELGSS